MRAAVEHIRRMKGGSQSHLMRCDDQEYYVVKFQNNPQHLRTLANEMFAARLATRMGICVPQVEVVEVSSDLIKYSQDLVIQYGLGSAPCSAGRQFGSKFPGDPSTTRIYDYLPDDDSSILNPTDFFGAFVFDKWTCNTDRRQAIFVRQRNAGSCGVPNKKFLAMMIDHGFCFNGGDWNFPDAPLSCLYANRSVYQTVTGIEAFDQWLDRLERRFTLDFLHEEGQRVPKEWYCEDEVAWERLIERLYSRRTRVRELIWSTRNTIRSAFPNWERSNCPVLTSEAH